MKHQHGFGIAAFLALSCLRPTEDRVERDLAVGQAEQAGVSVQVKDGLAVVRSFTDDELVLWGSAPGFELSLTVPSSRDLSVDVQNCLPDAELRVLSGDATLAAAEAGDVPTRPHWQLHAGAGVVRLALEAPDANDAEPFRFALLSDIQEAIVNVADIYARLNEQPNVRFVLGAGDLTQRGTREQLERFQQELLRLEIPYFATLGNHELGTHPDLFHDYFGRGNFHFRFRGVAFTLLDDGSASLDPTVYDWLDGWLAESRRDVHIVAMHIPPIDPIGVRNGSWASRDEAAKLLGRLAEGRVDLTLYGHIHSYYSFKNAGIQAFISGGGGAIPERFDGVGRHFMVFDVDAKHGVTEHNVVRVDPGD
jgi:3',5'-cyclic-AMP phosphodiesterase